MIVTDFTITPDFTPCPWEPGATATVYFAVDLEEYLPSMSMDATAVLADWWAARTSETVTATTHNDISAILTGYGVAPGAKITVESSITGFRYVEFEFTVPLDTIFPGGCGDPSVTIELSEPRGGPLLATATATLVEAAFVAVNDTAVADFETPISIDVLANDTLGGNPATPGALAGPPTVTTPPAHGTVSWNGSTFDYTPDAGYCGHDTFTYEIQT